MTYENVIKSIDKKRIDLGLNKKQLAEESGVHYTYLIDIMNGRQVMGFLTLLKINKVLKILKINNN